MSGTWSNCPINLFYFQDGVGWMEHAQCADVIGRRHHRHLSFRPSAVAAAPSASSSTSRQRLVPNRARRQSHPHPLHRTGLPVRMAHRALHNLRLARRLGTWCNLPATTGVCRGHMHGVQRGRLGEERYSLVVPVDGHDAPQRILGVPPYGKEMIFF
jgi:hypothetical protein